MEEQIRALDVHREISNLVNDALTREQIAAGTRCAVEAGADFIKPSTGFFTGGASVGAAPEVVEAMMEAGGDKIKVKRSGGLRTREQFLRLIGMGAVADGISRK